jgi:predicted SAM-dependent methyltransferase
LTDNSENELVRLNIGCGGRPLPEYINVDQDGLEELRRRYPEQTFADNLIIKDYDAFSMPYEGGSVDEVRADSFIEHLSFSEEPLFLHEAFRVLKSGGKLNISVPDFEEVVKIWLAAEDNWKDFFRTDDDAIRQEHWFGTYSYAMDNRWGYLTAMIYGPQNGDGQFHRNCYTEKKLRAICKHLGFGDVEISRFLWKGDRDPIVRIIATKP